MRAGLAGSAVAGAARPDQAASLSRQERPGAGRSAPAARGRAGRVDGAERAAARPSPELASPDPTPAPAAGKGRPGGGGPGGGAGGAGATQGEGAAAAATGRGRGPGSPPRGQGGRAGRGPSGELPQAPGLRQSPLIPVPSFQRLRSALRCPPRTPTSRRTRPRFLLRPASPPLWGRRGCREGGSGWRGPAAGAVRASGERLWGAGGRGAGVHWTRSSVGRSLTPPG